MQKSENKEVMHRLRRKAVVTAMENGIRKASLLLIGCKTLDESTVLLWFQENATFQLSEFAGGRLMEICIDTLITPGMSRAAARNLKKVAGIRTLQDLISSDEERFESGLKYARSPFRELLRAMRPGVIGKR